MSEEFKNSELNGEVKPEKKPFSVNISDEDFAASDIPAPEGENPDAKPHKVVRYVEAPKAEAKPKTEKKKKAGFLEGVAAGMKTVGEGISAGAKVATEKKPTEEKAPKAEKPVKEAPKAKAPVEDEVQFPTDSKPKAKKAAAGGFMAKLNALPTGAIIGGAVALVVVLVAVILIAATSCAPSDNTPSDGDSSEGSSGNGIVIGPQENEEKPDDEEDKTLEVPERKDKFVEAFNTNNDVMAWLYIPGLEDVDAGVCFSTNKNYPYNKRDITGKKVNGSYWIDGAYYTHYRNKRGDTAEELSTNTVIFGHSDLGVTNLAYSNDDPTGPLFSQLFKFKDPSFAEKTPYIYLTLPEENTVWEVFAVFYNDAKAMNKTFSPYYKSSAGDLWYIEPSPGTDEYALMLESVKNRSLYDYNVEVTAEDKILTLSTCTVAYGLKGRDNYRFVVVAKLVESEGLTEKNADFTLNEDAPLPKSYQEEFNKYLKEWKPSEK